MKQSLRILIFACIISSFSNTSWAQFATYGKLNLTAQYDQLRFEVPGENRYWLMSKTVGTNNKAYGFYSPDEVGWFTYWNAGTGDMIINKGNLGIGLTNPLEKLHVSGNSILNGRLKIDKAGTMGSKYNSAAAGLIVGDGNIDLIMDGNEIYSNHLLYIGSHQDHPIALGNVSGASFNSQLFIKEDGNVGIGTTEPRTNLHVVGPSESHSAKVTSFGNLSSDILLTSNTYRSFEGSAYTDGSGGSISRYIQYRSTHGGYLNYNNQGYGFWSQGGYPRMFMEVISGAHGTIGHLPSDSPIESGFIYQQIKGPSAGPLSEPIKATADNSTWLWGIKSDGQMVVENSIKTKEVNVTVDGFPDFVFDNDYPLMSLSDVQHYIKTYHHLPEIPSASEVQKNGIELGNLNKLLLQKIEELTLYTIEQEQKIESLESRNKQITEKHEKEISSIKEELLEIKELINKN